MNWFQRLADKTNHSPIWNHTMVMVLLYFWEMGIFITIFIYRYFFVGVIGDALKVWLIMTVPLIFGWLLLGLRNYYIHKKVGIWNYYNKKNRNGKFLG